ncbi:MAG: hypothetical protein ACRETG_07545, partial [Steroidobacteraceae bacterium]
MNRVNTRSGREAGSDNALEGLDTRAPLEFRAGSEKKSFQIMNLLNDLYRLRHTVAFEAYRRLRYALREMTRAPLVC